MRGSSILNIPEHIHRSNAWGSQGLPLQMYRFLKEYSLDSDIENS